MKKMGRPKMENPNNERIDIRIDKITLEKLYHISTHLKITRGETVRRLINSEYDKLFKENG